MLGTDDWLESVMFYDNRGRVVQTQGENHLGGTDIIVTQYDFSGRVLNTHTTHENPQASANSSTEILKTYEYDRTGRLLYVKQKIGSAGSVKTLVANTYNELGELESKALGTDPQNTSNPLETLDYDYNVRGWLKSVNGDYVANGTGSHYFGMDLSYDFGFESNRLNGNIAGVKWRTRSSPKMRAYGFDYDPVNRLLKADYHQKDATVETSWSKTLSDFSTSYGYDANGNILNLTRKGVVAGTITTIDQLTYDYGAGLNLAGASNQLMAVYDPQGDLGQGDFKDGNVGSDDYSYDANGNMKDDMNKGISNITYNHLNLPVTVSFGSTKTITYVYDAAGIKLAKVVDDNGSITTTDYAAGFIYENDELQHFAHEEGRMRKNNAGNLVYDYFIKDHLGNTRMTLTEEQVVTVYEATMETEYEAFEGELFLNLDDTRTTFLAANTTTDSNITADEVASLNGSDPDRRVGPAKLLAVSPGDQVDLAVMAYYEGTIGTNSALTDGEALITTAVAAAFGGSSTGNTEQQAIYSLFDDANYNLLVGSGATSTSQPRAYLNYLFFDQDFNYVGAKSGYKQVSAAAQQDVNDPNKPKELLTGTITVDQGGYVYVYLSNESQTDFDVYFDDLRVTHSKGAILQEDHYYPFGLSINALSSNAPLSKPNRYKFNGNEEQTDFDLNLYDFNARFYSPTVGRFINIDPLADDPKQFYLSPFQFSWNNPIKFNDPSGKCPPGVNCNAIEQWFQNKVDRFNAKIEQIKKNVREVGENINEQVKKLPKMSVEFTTHVCICAEIKSGNFLEIGLNAADAELTNSGFTLEDGQFKENIRFLAYAIEGGKDGAQDSEVPVDILSYNIKFFGFGYGQGRKIAIDNKMETGYTTKYTKVSAAYDYLGSDVIIESTAGDEPKSRVESGFTMGAKAIFGYEIKFKLELDDKDR